MTLAKKMFENILYSNNHIHTDYSNLRLLDCINKVEDIAKYSIELGYKSISITDHCSLSSHVQCMQINKELKKKGIDFKINLGDEIYLVDDYQKTRYEYQSKITKFYHFILVAKDDIGYKQLRKIDSLCWDNSFYTGKMRRTFIDRSQLEEIIGDDKGHLVATSGCLGGQLADLYSKLKDSNNIIDKYPIHNFITWCKDMFPNDFSFEMQPSDSEEQIEYNKFLIKMSECYNVPLTIHTDAHYLKKEDKDVHMAFLTSREADRGEGKDFYTTTYLMSIEEIWGYFKDYLSQDEFEQCIINSYNITKDCEMIDMEHGTIVPERNLDDIDFSVNHIFKDWYTKCPYIEKFAYSEFEQDRYLLYMIEVGFLEKNQELNEENIYRINTELEEIWGVSENLQQRVSAYYNLVDYIIDICWEIGFVGISRGSVTGYYTMYLIDMQQMNPIKWNLPHWRHLTKERPEMPDVDVDTSSKNRARIIKRLKEVFGEENILNICTFRTESTKSAIKTACRGLGINSDEADFLASLVKVERGKQWTIKDCLYGNKEKDRKPISELINEIDRIEDAYSHDDYSPHLQETIEKIDGLISGLSLHASGVYIFKNGYIEQNSKMKTPRGDDVTAWCMADSDYCGGLKYDSLTTECQDKLEVCIDYLLKSNRIEWQGSYRKTYNKYLHPDVLNYTNKEMWDKCSNGQVIDLFQFITPTGGACIKKVQPHSLVEMMNANSLMRISVKNGEQPIDKFIRYKADISLWYKELEEYGINNDEEIKELERILLPNYGVANTQEDIMELSMSSRICGFTLVEANKLRKIVAKKKDDKVAELREKIYKQGLELGNSIGVLNYVWEQCIVPQLAYSFSRNHVNPYSAEALQELNLYEFFPHCYWNCATLAVNAGSVDVTNDYDGIERNEDEEETVKNTEYGKVAKAIYRSKNFGVPILPPDINKSQLTFTPIEEDNTIRFGLAGISGINQDIAKEIIDGRPYESFEQFYNYHKNLQVFVGVDEDGGSLYRNSLLTKSKIISLIKSGCFDCFNPNRICLMKWLCVYETGKKDKLTSSNLPKCIELGVNLPKDLVKAYNFKKYVLSKQFLYRNNANFKSKKDYIVEPKFALPYLQERYMSDLEENKDYYYEDDNMIIVDKSLEKAMDKDLSKLKECLEKQEVVDDFNKKLLNKEYLEMIKEDEDVNKWSFDSVCFYDKEHELANTDLEQYDISSFSELPEDPLFEESIGRGGKVWKRYCLSRICGTVLSRNDNNHLVDILTPDEEVVTLNIPQGQFGFYKKVISETVGDKKISLEDSWLKRGNKIIVCGYRRGDAFFVKRYSKSIYQHSIVLIDKINEDGTLELRLERYNIDEEE